MSGGRGGSGREGAALSGVGLALGLGAAAFDRDPRIRRMKDSHFWLWWALTMIVSLAFLAVTVFAFVEMLEYLLHSTPCQRMGTC